MHQKNQHTVLYFRKYQKNELKIPFPRLHDGFYNVLLNHL